MTIRFLIVPGNSRSGRTYLRSYANDKPSPDLSVLDAIVRLVRRASNQDDVLYPDIDIEPCHELWSEAKTIYGAHRQLGCMLAIDPNKLRNREWPVSTAPFAISKGIYMTLSWYDIDHWKTEFSRFSRLDADSPSNTYREAELTRCRKLCEALDRYA